METEFVVTSIIRGFVKALDRENAIREFNDGGGSSRSETIQVIPLDQFGITIKHLDPIPRDQWPLWAKTLAQFATPQDKGIGDVAARMIGDENSAAFKLWFKATFGKDCGCNGRHAKWNLQYPL